MVRLRVRWLVLCLSISACNDPGELPGDATKPPPDVDNGNCGDLLRFTGEYVDWDSSRSAFCGILGARFSSVDGGGVDNTAPNGRFDLCVRNQALSLVEIGRSTQVSQCSMPAGSYALPALAVVSKDVILAGGAWSGRAFVMGRQAVDTAKAQVFVHVHGSARDVSLGAAHGPAQARSDTGGWAAGSMGQEVFFQDVEIGNGKTTISAAGAVVPAEIPLEAGTITNVTIVAR